MPGNLKKLVGARELLYMLTWRDIRVRYKQSVMGLLWAILMPSLIVGAGALVRVAAARWSGTTITAEDIASVMVRAVVWAFFISGLRFGTNSLIGNTNLVTKIAFPKEVFPIAAVLSSLFDFVVAAAAVLAVLLLMGWVPTWQALWALPIILTLVVFTTGMSLVMSAANLFYRDVKYIVEILLTYAIFFTPVLYEVEMAGEWQNTILLNPVAPLLEALSDSVVDHKAPQHTWMTYSFVVSALSLVVGYWAFKNLEKQFAERI